MILVTVLLTATSSMFGQDKMKDEGKHGFTMKQVKAFHDVLHPLVHDALPKGDFAKIRNTLDKLLVKATAIQNAKLPKALAGRKQEFDDACNTLVTQLEEMNAMKDKVDDDTLEKSFNEMHDTFEQLAQIAR